MFFSIITIKLSGVNKGGYWGYLPPPPRIQKARNELKMKKKTQLKPII
jgi:hypothetical protein